MKYFIFISITCLTLYACREELKKETIQVARERETIVDSTSHIDSNIVVDSIQLIPDSIITQSICNCKAEKFKRNRYKNGYQDSLRNILLNPTSTKEQLKYFKHLPTHWDSIPIEYYKLKYIETVHLKGHRKQLDYYGISNFKKLRQIELWGSKLDLEQLFNAAPNLEHIYMQKGIITNFSKLAKFKNLKTLYLSHVSIDEALPNISHLKCLNSLKLGAVRSKDASIPLSIIDFEKMPCLTKLHITDYSQIFTDFFIHFSANQLNYLMIEARNITDENMELIKNYKADRKKK